MLLFDAFAAQFEQTVRDAARRRWTKLYVCDSSDDTITTMTYTLDDIWTYEDGTIMFTDRDGNPMTLRAWSEKQTDTLYKTVKRTNIGDKTVHTIWVGVDQRFSGDGTNPLTFGSIVQHCDGTFDAESEQFTATEHDALQAHTNLVNNLTRRHR